MVASESVIETQLSFGELEFGADCEPGLTRSSFDELELYVDPYPDSGSGW